MKKISFNQNEKIRFLLLIKLLKANLNDKIIDIKEEKKLLKNLVLIEKELKRDEIYSNKQVKKAKKLEINSSKDTLLLIYVEHNLKEKIKVKINKWISSIKCKHYKIIFNNEELQESIKRGGVKAILSCGNFNNFIKDANIDLEILRNLELRWQGIPLIFTYLPEENEEKRERKREIWSDLKRLKGILFYG